MVIYTLKIRDALTLLPSDPKKFEYFKYCSIQRIKIPFKQVKKPKEIIHHVQGIIPFRELQMISSLSTRRIYKADKQFRLISHRKQNSPIQFYTNIIDHHSREKVCMVQYSDGTNISIQLLKTLNLKLQNQVEVIIFDLKYCTFDTKQCQYQIYSLISSCFKLKNFQIDYDSTQELENRDIQKLVSRFYKVYSLSELYLNFESTSSLIKENALQPLCERVKQFKNLKKLMLNTQGSNIRSTSIQSFIQSINSLPCLNQIDLNFSQGNNCVDDTCLIQLGEFLSGHAQITHFSFKASNRFSFISDQGFNFLCSGLKNCSKMRELVLYFDGSSISDQGICSLANQLNQLPVLVLLSLSVNFGKQQISDESVLAMVDAINQECKEIKYFNMSITGHQKISKQARKAVKLLGERISAFLWVELM